jgi:hypothetical protein
MQAINLKRAFLYLLIASVAASAVIGIVVVLFGNFGEFETKVLMTALIVTAVSVMGLACGACLEARKGRLVPIAGILFAVLSGILWMVMLWSKFEPGNDVFVHSLMSATVIALGCAHISLLSLARLDRRFYWSRIAAHVAVWSLTGLLLIIFWADIDPSQNILARTMGVLSIVIAALTVVTPVFHHLSSSGDDAAKIDAEIADLTARIEKLKQQRVKLTGDLPVDS